MKKRIRLFCCALSAILLMTACSSGSDTASNEFDDTESQVVTEAVEPSFDEDNLFIQSGEDGTIVFDGDAKVTGDGLYADGSAVTVSGEGVYRVSGSSSDGQIIIDCTNKDDVTLIFDNLTLNSKDSPAVWCLEADTLTISLPEGSQSSISDGSERPDADTPDAAIFSKGDLYFNGKGTLNIEGSANNALESKDGLTILQCTLDITAVDDGIIGKDSLEVGAGAVIGIDSDGDGMRSTNTEDEGRGSIYLGECTLNIDSGADAVQAVVSLTVDSGAVLNIVTGGGAENGSSNGGNGFGGWGWGWDYGSSSEEESTASMKGLKASSAVFINGGVITADCADDTVHCNGDIYISDGTLTLASGDDGIHADSELTITGGSIAITESYEGLEANVITVSNGYIDLISSDDGINVAGGNDSSSTGGMWGNDMFAEDESCLLSVSGGCILINASGDGVDSNGSIKMSGGELSISGPTNSGNGFLDFAGDFEITGGTLLALGTSGMAQTTNAGTQASIVASINGTVPAGTLLTLKTADGKEIDTYTAPKNYNFIVASSPLMSEGEEVYIYLDGELLGSLEASVIISSGGMSMGGMGGGGGHGGHGGGHGPGGR